MALLCMAVFDTEDNGRSVLTEKTLNGLRNTVDFGRHRLIVSDNNSCYKTKRILKFYQVLIPTMRIITFSENVGTAKAINAGWANRFPGEHCIKMDNDIVVHDKGWVDMLERVIEKDDAIGQCALKRVDLLEHPDNPHDWYHSTLRMLPHTAGEPYYVVEEVEHCIGSCVMHSSKLIGRVGALKQFGVYSFDDALMSLRSALAGFKNVFLPHVRIDHLDVDDDGAYTRWKQQYADDKAYEYGKIKIEYLNGTRDIYEPL